MIDQKTYARPGEAEIVAREMTSKLGRIKVVRGLTGATLAECKAAVEKWDAVESSPRQDIARLNRIEARLAVLEAMQ